MNTLQKLLVAFLAAMALLLVIIFLLAYLTDNGGDAVELTTPSPSASPAADPSNPEDPESVGSDSPADASPSPDVAPRIRVYVAGAVREPGVYSLKDGDRLVDAVAMAGGATASADLETVNLAVRLEDEDYYYIPGIAPATNEEEEPETVPAGSSAPDPDGESSPADEAEQPIPSIATNSPEASVPDGEADTPTPEVESVQVVNLNTATQSELETLPGIGPARASAIVAYREEHGPFTTIEEITAVSGIGQGILDSLQGLITVEETP